MLSDNSEVITKVFEACRRLLSFRVCGLAATVVLLAGSGCDIGSESEDPGVESQRLRTEAVMAMTHRDNLRAEQLFSRVVPLDQQLQRWDWLAEDRATLAKIQTSLGFFSSAIENDIEAWKYYRELGDHATEIRLMNSIGMIYVGLGDFEKGIGYLSDALEVSRLAANNVPDPETNINLGDAYLWSGQDEAAADQYALAFNTFNKRKYAPAVVRALSRLGYASAKLGRRENALSAFFNVETILASVQNVIVKGQFCYDRGRSLELLGEWSRSAQSLRDGIALLQNLPANDHDDQTKNLLVLLYTALGKNYSHNYAYPLARENFVAAYSIAKDAGEKIPLGYLLIAIADCERRLSAVDVSQEASIAATTYYEQAVTLFSRIGNISGEAYATYKLGVMKEEQGNISTALDLYKRTFDLCSVPYGEFRNWRDDEEFLGLRETGRTPHIPFSEETYWYQPLVVTLARLGRAEEALRYFEEGKTRSLSAQLNAITFEGREADLQLAVQAFQQKTRALLIRDGERSYQRGLDARQRDAEKISLLTHEVVARRDELATTAALLGKKYPRLEILFGIPDISSAALHSAMSYGSVILDYFIADDRILIFVVSYDGIENRPPISVVEVPAYRDIVVDKVHQFSLMLRERIHRIGTGYTQTTDIEHVSQEMYNYFLRPVERLFVQRVVIIPPRGMEKVPFHAFTRATNEGVKPLIDIADVSYLPYLASVASLSSPPRFIHTVVAMGNPRSNNWPLDFELRDIRSFFREASVAVSQNANEKQLFESYGDVLQLSTDFITDTLLPDRSTFVLSSGSITNPGADIPVSEFFRLYPFPIVYLSDQQSEESGLAPLHAALLMMNGSSHVIMNFSPCEPKVNKFFSERFYAMLAKGGTANEAYRSAVVGLSRSRNFSAPYLWSQFFKFGK